MSSKPVLLTPVPASLTPSMLWAEANLGTFPLGIWKSWPPAWHRTLKGSFSPESKTESVGGGWLASDGKGGPLRTYHSASPFFLNIWKYLERILPTFFPSFIGEVTGMFFASQFEFTLQGNFSSRPWASSWILFYDPNCWNSSYELRGDSFGYNAQWDPQ